MDNEILETFSECLKDVVVHSLAATYSATGSNKKRNVDASSADNSLINKNNLIGDDSIDRYCPPSEMQQLPGVPQFFKSNSGRAQDSHVALLQDMPALLSAHSLTLEPTVFIPENSYFFETSKKHK